MVAELFTITTIPAAESKASEPAWQQQPAGSDTRARNDPEILGTIAALRAQQRESLGKIAMALPRYRHNMLADRNNIVLEPLCRDRIRSPIRVKTRAAP